MIFTFTINAESSSSNCTGEIVCVVEGTFLKYKAETAFLSVENIECCNKGFLIFNFGKFIDDDRITLELLFESESGEVFINEEGIMNVRTGFLEITSTEGLVIKEHMLPFRLWGLSTVSLSSEQLVFDITKGKHSGWYGSAEPRDTIFLRSEIHLNVDIFVDDETRIVTKSHYYNSYGSGIMVAYTLVETNIFQKLEDTSTVSTLESIQVEQIPKIPDWIRNNAGWWSEGSIGDSDFLQGIQFLIKENIISIPDLTEEVTQMELKDEKRAMGMEREQNVPDWVRNNAGWWADGLISDDDFVSGIKYLVEQGIIKI